MPDWNPIGPAPQQDGALSFLNPPGYPQRAAPVTGRVAALAYSPDIGGGQQALFLGAASGGIWRTTDFLPKSTTLSPTPKWQQVSDKLFNGPNGAGGAVAPESVPGVNNIGCLAVDPNPGQSHVIYAGTGEANYNTASGYGAGILKSTDGGNNWFLVSKQFYGRSISKILVTPAAKNIGAGILFAAVVPFGRVAPDVLCGIYWSPDGGVNWHKLKVTQPPADDPPIVVTDMVWTVVQNDKKNNLYLYAGMGDVRNYYGYPSGTNGIWLSKDGGDSWVPVMGPGDPKRPTIGRISLAADQRLQGQTAPAVYAAIAEAPAKPFRFPLMARQGPTLLQRVIKTLNNAGTLIPPGGPAWLDITPDTPGAPLALPPGFVPPPPPDPGIPPGFPTLFGGQGSFDLAIGVVPGQPQTVYLAGVNAFRTTNGGTNWTLADYGPGTSPHVDHHAWAFAGSSVFDGNDGGIWMFAPPAAGGPPAWTDLNTPAPPPPGLQTNQVNAVASNDKASPNAIYLAGSQDNGTAFWDTEPPKNPNIANWKTVGGFDGGLVRFDPTGSFAYRIQGGAQPPDIFQQSPLPTGVGPLGAVWASVMGGIFIRGGANQPDVVKDTFPFGTVFAISPKPTPGKPPQPPHMVLASTKFIWDNRSPGTDGTVANPMVWRNVTPEGSGFLGGAPITALAFLTDQIVYAGLGNGDLYRTWDVTEKSPKWELISQFGTLQGVGWGPRAIAGLFPTDRGGLLVAVAENPGGGRLLLPAGVFYVMDAPASDTFPGGVRSASLFGTGLPTATISTLWLDQRDRRPGGLQVLYAGTGVGVFSSPRPTTGIVRTWTPAGSGIPTVSVKDLQFDSSGSLLIAATYGRGIYRWAPPLPGPAGMGAIEGSRTTFTLATFTDPSGSGPYTPSINWGDGSAPDPTGNISSSGTTQTVSGTHTFEEVGLYTVLLTLTPSTGPALVLSTVAAVADAALSALPATVSGTSLALLANALVATFTDPNPYRQASDFTATVGWGNGLYSPGTVSGSSGNFNVNASTTYPNAGTFPVTVLIQADLDNSVVANSTANISGTVALQAGYLTPTEGTSTGTVTLATFTASGGGTFTAAIAWGDGNTSTGTVTLSGSTYSVTGSNTYGAAGTYPLTVAVFNSGVLAGSITTSVIVGDAPLSLLGQNVQATQGVPLNGFVLARFTDANAGDSPSDYTAIVNWDDGSSGTSSDDGSLTVAIVPEGGGTFAVTGNYTYLQAGTYSLGITLVDAAGGSVQATASVTVSQAAPAIASVFPPSGPPNGGTLVRIQGTNLFGASAVTFGGISAPFFTVNADGSVIAAAPAGSAGTVDVQVTTPGGTSPATAADQFSYVNTAPGVTGLSASSGPTGGGNSITINGSNFDAATAVLFGTTPADGFTVTSNTTITATVPAQAAGTVDVTVVTPYGTSATSSADQYSFTGTAPTVTGLNTTSGPAAGGAFLTVQGTNLNLASQVLFDTTPATAFTVLSSTAILVTTPTLSPGTYDVIVTTPYGTSATSSADQFTAVVAPSVTGLSPSSGASGGGDSIALTGSGFTGAFQVLFGDYPAVFTVNSDTSITATSPAQPAGAVNVTVSTAGGDSAPGAGSTYTYNATAPVVSGLSVSQGPTAGGTSIVITGSNFNGATSVAFGAVAAPGFSVDSPTQITATAPAQSAATVDVTVTTPYGTSPTSSADKYTYVDAAAPAVTGLGVGSGPMAGGTSVTLSGSGFTAATAVSFGANAAASYTVNSDTQITAVSPPGSAGVVDVVVTTPYGTSQASPADQFTYQAAVPSVTGLSVNTGPTSGGTSVTLSGANLTGATQVAFGNVQAPPFTFNSDSSLTVTAPLQAPGTVYVTVTTPNGTSATGSAVQFTYTAATGLPVVTGLTVSSGPTGGGTAVTISGSGFTGATNVTFGTANVPIFAVNSAGTAITTTAPPAAAGTVDVTVTTPAGISAPVSADQYVYTAAGPAVSGLSPGTAPTTGGSAVTVPGSNLNGATQVTVGSTPAAFTVNSATSITATVPASVAGTFAVVVTTPYGTSSPGTGALLEYLTAPPPAVTGVSPNSGPMAGGTAVTIGGSGFTGATQVLFGTVPASGVTVNSDTQITATAPPQVAASVDVLVQTPSGVSPAVPADVFTYNAAIPVVSSLGTSSGPTAGGTPVAINGSNLLAATQVYFGTTLVPFTIVSDSQIAAASPPGAPAMADVTVVSPYGTSATSPADQFTWNNDPTATPAVTSLSTSSGPSSGGTSVVITGSNLAGTTLVLFGGVGAPFTLLSSTSLSAVSPPQPTGTVADVQVVTPLGISAIVSADQFTYQSAPPTVTGVARRRTPPRAAAWSPSRAPTWPPPSPSCSAATPPTSSASSRTPPSPSSIRWGPRRRWTSR